MQKGARASNSRFGENPLLCKHCHPIVYHRGKSKLKNHHSRMKMSIQMKKMKLISFSASTRRST